jgi:hypothetical protein
MSPMITFGPGAHVVQPDIVTGMRPFVALLVLAAACSSGSTASEESAAAPLPPTPVPTTAVTTTTAAPMTTGAPTTAPPVPTTGAALTTTTIPAAPRGNWFVVWVTGWNPDGFSDALREAPGVGVVSQVWVGNAHVVETRSAAGEVVDSTEPRFVIPVELQAVDPTGHRGFVPIEVYFLLADLAPDEVLLGRSSARLRRLGPGGTLTLEDGTTLTVAGIVDDRWVGAAEMVTTSSEAAALGADRERYAVVRFDGSREQLESETTALTDKAVRVWAEDQVEMFRHADAVQPQVRIKERFGEFSYRPRGGQAVQIDPDWVDANIAAVRLPLIGWVTCHRDFAELLRRAMEELQAGGNGNIVNATSDNGCWNARFIAGRRDLSRHAWGIAADINFGNSHGGGQSPVAPELLAAMEAVGITSGHTWINPDPGHFEWVGPSG